MAFLCTSAESGFYTKIKRIFKRKLSLAVFSETKRLFNTLFQNVFKALKFSLEFKEGTKIVLVEE